MAIKALGKILKIDHSATWWLEKTFLFPLPILLVGTSGVELADIDPAVVLPAADPVEAAPGPPARPRNAEGNPACL